MLRDEYLRRLVDESYIDVYLSATDGKRIYWPWRMQPPKDASRGYRNACESYVIDSDPNDDTVTTTEVLDTAYRLDAEVASLQDVYQNKNATVDSLLKGLETADDHAFDGTLLLPLQSPFVDCWEELGEPTDYWIGIGGLKSEPPSDRISAARNLRSVIGNKTHIHGFGWGVKDIAHHVRNDPGLIDSVDYSTPMQDNIMGVTPGDERMSVSAMRAATQLVTDLRLVSPYVDGKQIPEEGQSGIGAYE